MDGTFVILGLDLNALNRFLIVINKIELTIKYSLKIEHDQQLPFL